MCCYYILSFLLNRILFVFHLNKHDATKAKVKVPRLDGAKKGVFSCRTPYRPSPIGLTLAKIEAIEGKTFTHSLHTPQTTYLTYDCL